MAADIGAASADFAEVDADAAAHFAQTSHVGIGVEDALKRVVHRIDKAAGELTGDFFTGIGHGWGCGGHINVAHRPIRFLDQFQAFLFRLLVHQVHRDDHIALLRQLHRPSVEIGGEVTLGQR
ncbi:hypothetical protein D3C74_248470 [compost metagenome]